MGHDSLPIIPGALIVAAGYSSRMGHFKPLLPLDGRLVIEWPIESLRQAGITDITVVIGHNADALIPLLNSLQVNWVRNPHYQRGMFSSVKTGISALPLTLDSCFFLPVDIPLVRPQTIIGMLEMASRDVPVLYPTFRGKRGHPPLIASSLFPNILSADDDNSLRTILEDCAGQSREWPVFDRGVLMDMDILSQYDTIAGKSRYVHIPDDEECAALFDHVTLPEPVRQHASAVAKIADLLATALNGVGIHLDTHLLRAGALLHDIAKGHPNHAGVGAALLNRHGFTAVAAIVGSHTDMTFHGVLDERALVYLADKLVHGDRLCSLNQRRQQSLARFADSGQALQIATRRWDVAQSIAAVMEARLGVPVETYLHRKMMSRPAETAPCAPISPSLDERSFEAARRER